MTKTKDNSNKKKSIATILGYRCLVEMLPDQDRLRDSWLWIPGENRHKFKPARIIQIGKFEINKKHPQVEVAVGNVVLIDTNYGSQVVKEGNRTFNVVSYRDVAAVLDESPD